MRAEIMHMPRDGRMWFLVRERDIQFRPERFPFGSRLNAINLQTFQDLVPSVSWDQVLVGIETQGTADIPDEIIELAVYTADRRLILSRSGIFPLHGFTLRQPEAFRAEMDKLMEKYRDTNVAAHLKNEMIYCAELESILNRRGLH